MLVARLSKSAVVTNEAEVLNRLRVPTSAALGTDVVYNNIVESVETLRSQLGAEHTVVAVGVVVTGIVDEKSGSAIHSENVGWNNIACVRCSRRNSDSRSDSDTTCAPELCRRSTWCRAWLRRLRVRRDRDRCFGSVIVDGKMVTGGGYAGMRSDTSTPGATSCARVAVAVVSKQSRRRQQSPAATASPLAKTWTAPRKLPNVCRPGIRQPSQCGRTRSMHSRLRSRGPAESSHRKPSSSVVAWRALEIFCLIHCESSSRSR